MPNIGDRYIALVTAHGWTANNIYEWNGSSWDETTPVEGDIVFVTDIAAEFVFGAGGQWAGPIALAVRDFGVDVQTPLSKVERVSRQMDAATFVANQGDWVVLNDDGTIEKVTVDTPAKVNKMLLGSRTASKYESSDTAHGRITTMESIGVRIRLSYSKYVGVIEVGDRLAVSTYVDTLGKLISIEQAYETGDYEVVAVAEEVHISEGWIIIRTVSPTIVTVA